MTAFPDPTPDDLVTQGLDQSFAGHGLGYWRVDNQSRVRAVNQAYCRMSGFTREEILDHSVVDFVIGLGPDEVSARHRQAHMAGWTRFSRQHRDAGGLVFPLEVQLIAIPHLDQTIALMEKTGESTSAQAPDTSGGRFRRLVEQQGDGFTITDINEVVTFANLASEAIMGVPPGSLVGRSLHEFLDPDQLDLVLEQTRERQAGKEGGYELRIRRPDGVARILYVTVTRELDEGGRYLGSVGVFRDITDRRRAEDKLRASEARFRALVDGAPVAIAMTRGWRFLQVNPQFVELLGFERAEELLGSPILDRVHPDDHEAFQAFPHHPNADPTHPGEFTFRGLRQDGSPLLLRSWLRNLPLNDGPAYLGFFEDITLRRKAEEDRERLIRELTQALGEVRQLSGLLPICGHCKKVRDDQGYWNQIEGYIAARSAAQFSHGICPDCLQQHFPDFDPDSPEQL